jgi:hypothetical protein
MAASRKRRSYPSGTVGAAAGRLPIGRRLPTCPTMRQAANCAGVSPELRALQAGRLTIGRRMPSCPTKSSLRAKKDIDSSTRFFRDCARKKRPMRGSRILEASTKLCRYGHSSCTSLQRLTRGDAKSSRRAKIGMNCSTSESGSTSSRASTHVAQPYPACNQDALPHQVKLAISALIDSYSGCLASDGMFRRNRSIG